MAEGGYLTENYSNEYLKRVLSPRPECPFKIFSRWEREYEAYISFIAFNRNGQYRDSTDTVSGGTDNVSIEIKCGTQRARATSSHNFEFLLQASL